MSSNTQNSKAAAVAVSSGSARTANKSSTHLKELPGAVFASAISKYHEGTQVIVTVQGHDFKLPKALLCDMSAFFDRALNGNFQEAIEQRVTLEEADKDSFERVIRWMYMGDSGIQKSRESTVVDDYICFFMLAEYLDLHEPLVSDFDALTKIL